MRASRGQPVDAPGRRVVALLVPLAMMMLLMGPAWAAEDPRPLRMRLEGAGIGVPPKPFSAPSFSVPDLAGGTVDLDGLRGRVVLLYFWTTW